MKTRYECKCSRPAPGRLPDGTFCCVDCRLPCPPPKISPAASASSATAEHESTCDTSGRAGVGCDFHEPNGAAVPPEGGKESDS